MNNSGSVDGSNEDEQGLKESVSLAVNELVHGQNYIEKGNELSETFKKPQFIIGPQRNKLNKTQKNCTKIDECETVKAQSDEPKQDTDILLAKPDKKVESPSKPNPSLPYKEPDWAGIPNSNNYKLEELKSGVIVKTISLTDRSFYVFGRLPCCDIPMLHPTVSRYHAVLQYRATRDGEDEPGFYIYDLGSSLGTFLNKQKLRPKVYVRVRVGHVLKISCSTRMFILQGPEEDEEPESELTVTELKQQYKEKLAALEAEKERRKAESEKEEQERIRREEEMGIDWGMGEDADEETDLTENPYAETQNEELYLDDPKKTLRGWFEREGEELVYDVEEKGFGHFICRIELPVDNGGGGNLVAEASVRGKKKEAVVQAALEACRMLDRQGLLRQATHESKKRAAKDWEANDYYDSDEDNFLDRTGQIEKKRKQRMAQSGKLEQEVETYDTLVEKYSGIVKNLERTERKLQEMLTLATKTGQEEEEVDDLDAYMNRLQQEPVDKIEIKRMKDEVAQLRLEEGRVRKLVNLARPTELPELKPLPKPAKDKKLELPQGSIGKISQRKRPHHETILPRETTQQHAFHEDVEEEFYEEEDKSEPNKSNTSKEMECEELQQKEENTFKKKRNRQDTRKRKQNVPPVKVDGEEYSTCTWTPPVGQTGDGRTSLNDKLGY